jgi:methionyl-tRNA formyltransferase
VNAPLRLIYMSTAGIGLPTLKYLAANPKVELVSIISGPDRQVGRGLKWQSNEIVQFAKEQQLPYATPEKLKDYQHQHQDQDQQDLKIDAILVFAYGQFLNRYWLELGKYGAFNLHTSLLPKYRGASPIQQAILNGDADTGISLQRMVKQMDAGDILLDRQLALDGSETFASLSERLALEAVPLVQEWIDLLWEPTSVLKYKPQREELVTLAPLIKKEQGQIDFSTMSAQQIERMVRAFTPWPGCFFWHQDERIKVHQVTVASALPLQRQYGITGALLSHEQQLYAFCAADQQWLRLDRVQREGKGIIAGGQFLI